MTNGITREMAAELRDDIRSTFKDLREEVRALHDGVRATSEQAHETRISLKGCIDRLEHQQVEHEIRISRQLADLAAMAAEIRNLCP